MKEIRNIIDIYHATDWSHEKAALATVVHIEQSAYRRIGARLYVKSTGIWVGGISGGCLEGDALRRAQEAIFKNEPSIVTYDTIEDDEHQIGVGLGCNGRIDVLFVPINPNIQNNPIEQLIQVTSIRQPKILVQLISSQDKCIELDGQIYLQDDKEEIIDDIKVSSADLNNAFELVKSKAKSKVLPLTTQSGKEVEILFEWLRPEQKLIVVGDNYDVNALAGIVRELGWELFLIGTLRKLDKSIFNIAKKVVHYDQADKLSVDEFTAVLLMSHDYKRDMQMAKHFLPRQPKYLGMLGPKKRMLKMSDELEAESFEYSLKNYPHLYSPVGLDIGAESPEEIAASIISEIISTSRNRGGTPLRLRKGSIHKRD